MSALERLKDELERAQSRLRNHAVTMHRNDLALALAVIDAAQEYLKSYGTGPAKIGARRCELHDTLDVLTKD